jgi:hypothetical protein
MGVILVNTPGGGALETVDEEALGRLRDAITAEDVEEEEQLQGVLRMLAKGMPDDHQLPLFDARPRGGGRS